MEPILSNLQSVGTSRHLPSRTRLGLVPNPRCYSTIHGNTGVNWNPYSGCYITSTCFAPQLGYYWHGTLLFLESAAELPSAPSIDHAFVTIALTGAYRPGIFISVCLRLSHLWYLLPSLPHAHVTDANYIIKRNQAPYLLLLHVSALTWYRVGQHTSVQYRLTAGAETIRSGAIFCLPLERDKQRAELVQHGF
jgi:hypothetical protein